MKTLLQCINGFMDNISVTDRQEDKIKGSINNLTSCLKDPAGDLHVKEVFTNGSYERDTIISPLKDIDLFAVLDEKGWKDSNGQLRTPQSVLTKMKDYLNDIHDYKDKVKQDRPCVTVELSDKDFDVLPSFEQPDGSYLIPSYDLKTWINSYPKQLQQQLDQADSQRNRKVRPIIKAVKNWNRENDHLIPSYHIEEVAINIFLANSISDLADGIRKWFDNAEYNMRSERFKSNDEYIAACNKVKKVKEKLNRAKTLFDSDKKGDAIQIWKEVFGAKFPTVDLDEAKEYSKALGEGNLKVQSNTNLSLTKGKNIPASKGFFGDVQKRD